ncbi:DUF2268 domain-containing putative Zn-dependent protease [Pseudomonas hefeiensis]|uniref:DUF2268 domain-containing putative Zn-dependent protease n=1 Tax=Pseudomonas hefeiensis TaxID=2738125 RepID=A0ABY9G4Q1_9PSED|nr:MULTISPECIES: DUF2268 domain-containing putative Zn-dependent protease [unclassified Pseudomonas]WLH10596.1 DUF2268 domain-containing putative Zn-dependent protease [Pseudomonas sp. FP205]WLH93674.1 DUF2268 domain-containing putative Zn-dependent protease [Pseudomonas sp. FP53]WLI37956.1 DUF2268 domain-containing putative Zn-dependent protease [Pseudomonas sp. FP821]
MEKWTLHWLEASGSLAEFRRELTDEFDAAYETLARLMPPPRLDVLIQRLPGETIPEMGLVGRAYRSSMFSMTLDPDNPNFLSSLRTGALRRHVIHEVHHCLRMGGPGYGWTLGEALVSEGLAGQFVRHLLGSDPEPWECAIEFADLSNSPVGLQGLESRYYDHNEWFFGFGDKPRWLGYSLGYQMAGRWLASRGEVDVSTWVNVPATDIMAIALEEGLVSAES